MERGSVLCTYTPAWLTNRLSTTSEAVIFLLNLRKEGRECIYVTLSCVLVLFVYLFCRKGESSTKSYLSKINPLVTAPRYRYDWKSKLCPCLKRTFLRKWSRRTGKRCTMIRSGNIHSKMMEQLWKDERIIPNHETLLKDDTKLLKMIENYREWYKMVEHYWNL